MAELAQLESTALRAPERRSEASTRLVSMDAFRGLVMVLMLAEVMRLPEVAQAFPHSLFWRIVGFNTEHVEWQGCSLHDLIQPAFSFLVGAALPFSIASRTRKGQNFGQMLGHAVWRALLLIVLGIFLRSLHSPRTYFTFEDTLTQIGLGYVFLFVLGFSRVRTQVITFALIMVLFWAAFALYPAPAANFDYARVGVLPSWEHNYTGFFAHWNKNSNLSWAFDVWFLNLFQREQLLVFNQGGWAFSLVVVGMNSIAIYVMSWTMKGFIGDSLDRHFSSVFGVAGATFQPVLHGFGVLVVFWCILFWMYRKKIFLRI